MLFKLLSKYQISRLQAHEKKIDFTFNNRQSYNVNVMSW